MNKARIYLEAAEAVAGAHEIYPSGFTPYNDRENDTYTCRAVQKAATGCGDGCLLFPHKATRAYQRAFRPRGWTPFFGNDWAIGWRPGIADCRVLALCFAAAMAEAGDL